MAQGELSLQLSCRLKRNAHHNQNGGAAERDRRDLAAADDIDDDREHCDNAQEQSAHQSDLIQDLLDIIRSGATGADAQDKAAVLLEIICNLNGIERNLRIEVCKKNDENEVAKRVEPGIRGEDL